MMDNKEIIERLEYILSEHSGALSGPPIKQLIDDIQPKPRVFYVNEYTTDFGGALESLTTSKEMAEGAIGFIRRIKLIEDTTYEG